MADLLQILYLSVVNRDWVRGARRLFLSADDLVIVGSAAMKTYIDANYDLEVLSKYFDKILFNIL